MNRRKDVAKRAFAEALRTRRTSGRERHEPICVYDVAESLGIEVRFIDIPSLEGIYVAGARPNIILSSMRPPGRTAFNCAHELGHHNNGDGTVVDNLLDGEGDPQSRLREFAADCFAGALLMPKMAVQRAFALRGWNADEPSPEQVYAISQYFGVGYSTLIEHMHRALGILEKTRAAALSKIKPRQAQAMLLGLDVREPVVPVDAFWIHHPVDVETDALIFAAGNPKVEGNCVELVGRINAGSMWRATQPGIGRIENGAGFSAFIRVSKRGFVGRSVFRHLPDYDVEEPCVH